MITNNYRTYERGRRKKRACAVDGRARGPRGEQGPEPLSGISRVCRRQRVFRFDFHVNHRVQRRRRRKGRGTPAGAKVTARSRRGGGRCGTMRWGSHGYKIGINESGTACPAARFSISIMNLGAHRPATDESNETLAACSCRRRASRFCVPSPRGRRRSRARAWRRPSGARRPTGGSWSCAGARSGRVNVARCVGRRIDGLSRVWLHR